MTICQICGGTFEQGQRRAKYCDKCRDRIIERHDYLEYSHQTATRCIICGKPLPDKKQYACSTNCARLLRNIVAQQRKELRQAEKRGIIPIQTGDTKQEEGVLSRKRNGMSKLGRDIAEARRLGISYAYMMVQRYLDKQKEHHDEQRTT